jgi:hypothetical protein
METPVLREMETQVQPLAKVKKPGLFSKFRQMFQSKPSCPSGYELDANGRCAQVLAVSCAELEGCKVQLKSMGLKATEAQNLLENVKSDLLQCQSSQEGWKEIEDALRQYGLSKPQAKRILVAVGNNLLSQVLAGADLDDLFRTKLKQVMAAAPTFLPPPPPSTLPPPPPLVPMPAAQAAKPIVMPLPAAALPDQPTSAAKNFPAVAPASLLSEIRSGQVLRQVTPSVQKPTQEGLANIFLQSPLAKRKLAMSGEETTASISDWDE